MKFGLVSYTDPLVATLFGLDIFQEHGRLGCCEDVGIVHDEPPKSLQLGKL